MNDDTQEEVTEEEATTPSTIQEAILSEHQLKEQLSIFEPRAFPLKSSRVRFSKHWETFELMLDNAPFCPTKKALAELKVIVGFNPGYLPRDTNKANRIWQIILEDSPDDVPVIMDGKNILRFGEGPNPREIMDEVLGLDIDLGVTKISVDSSRVFIDTVDKATIKEPTGVAEVGDISYGGFSISVNGGVLVEPYVYRLQCTNGMRVKKRLEYESCQSIRPALAESKRLLDSFMALTEDRFDLKVATSSLQAAGASDRDTIAVLKRVEKDGATTNYDFVNIVTTIAKENRKKRLEYIAGNLCGVYHIRRCGECGSLIR